MENEMINEVIESEVTPIRTKVIREVKEEYVFDMTDQDVLDSVVKVKEMKSELITLERQKDSINAQVKAKKADIECKLKDITDRRESRLVDCDEVFDYELKRVSIEFDGTHMESRVMSDWEYKNRPADIFPEPKAKDDETELEVAMGRANEIKEKEANMVVTSADVKAPTEAKSEKSAIIVAETLD